MLPNLGTRFLFIGFVLLVPTLILLFGGPFNMGLDIKGGTSLIYNVPGDPSADELGDVRDVMTQRVDRLGLKEITITTDDGHNDIIIELPGMTAADSATVKRTLLELGKLIWAIEATEQELTDPVEGLGPKFNLNQFLQEEAERTRRLVEANPEEYDPRGYTGEPVHLYKNPENFRVARSPGDPELFTFYPPYRWRSTKPGLAEEARWKGPDVGAVVLKKPGTVISGEEIDNVYPSTGRFEPVVAFELRPESKDAFRDLTRRYLKRNLCIIFNERLVTRPVIQAVLPGSGVIEGISEREEIRKLIVTIKSGSLKIKPVLFMEQQIGPTLGEDAIRRAVLAMVVGSVAVLFFMLWIYRFAGLLANVALLANLLVLLGVMKMMGATLSLPGIAGIVLTIGIAVDANILIFERVKEERDKGKTFIQSLKNGYDRATVTILDANITTLLTGLVLYMFGTGPIRGFAFVLIAGLIINLFTAIYMTKTVLAWLLDRKRITDLKVVRLFTPPQWDFLRAGRFALLGSAGAIAIGLFFFFWVQGESIKGLDFSGGALMRLQLKEPVDIAQFRTRMQTIEGVDPHLDVVTVRGVAATTLPGGRGSNIFEIKQSLAQDDVEAADAFFQRVHTGLADLLADEPIIPYRAPAEHPYQYQGAGGDDPGRVPAWPPGKTPQTEEERLIVQVQQGFRFTVNFYKPTARSILEQNLRYIEVAPAQITPRDAADGEGRHKSYEVWCTAGPFLPGVAKLSELGGRLAVKLKEERPNPIHLSEPVPVQRFIGPRVARDLVKKAILAVLVALVALMIYIRIRFHDLLYGIGAATALLHDVLLTMGFIAVFDSLGVVNVKITLPIIAAFLSLIGYSLNDTIVIFDRLRENLARVNMPLKEAMNLSIAQSLTRTFFTSLTTFCVVACLFAFNYGERGVLEGLGFALMVGVVTGTYSTIFVACPTVLLLSALRRRGTTAGKGS
ncbi:MAG: protein translocase subunit SecD [Planctomycetes bacterium]|nr:protein translocase subunit SecD [Planctomycetota bacterium]